MPSIDKKRGRDNTDPAGKNSKKRQKLQKQAGTETSDAQSSSGYVNVDDLDWKAVAIPDRLEDAEGFYGLEEIDGVDILKPEGGGEIKFKAVKGKAKRKAAKVPKGAPATVEDAAEEEEWAGFSDEEQLEQKSQAAEDGTKQKHNAEKKSKKQEKKQKADQKSKGKQLAAIETKNGLQAAVSFSALEDQDEDEVDISAWDDLNLRPEIQTSLARLKFTTPTPIQSACIPPVAAGHDVIGKASTGSGKTLAFGIPILEHYLKYRHDTGKAKRSDDGKSHGHPIALILSPTRELAHQLSKHLGELSSHAPNVNARIALVTGGLSVYKQQRQLADADIVIATPGRLWDVISSGQGLVSKLKKAKFLVIDEADRLLTEGHYKELGQILDALDREEVDEEPGAGPSEESDEESQERKDERQTLVFSATFHKGLQQKLAGKSRHFSGDLLDKKESMEYLLQKLKFREEKPKFIDVNPVSQMAENLKEGLVECAAMEKDLYLYTLLLYHPKHRTLVFTNSISAVRRLTTFLQTLSLPALALHSSMPQKSRLRSVERFSSPSSDPSSILVATDVAARGLDIKGIDLIIHYHVPRTADVYVHRSGRTARASASGKSILICSPDEVVGVARLAAKVHASNDDQGSQKQPRKRLPLETLDLDRRIASRIKPRVTLAQKITSSTQAKEKLSSEEDWLRSAAEDLGVDYDSEEFAERVRSNTRGRGGGRKEKERQAGSLSKAEVGAMRAQLRELLGKKINVGVSERYLTAGGVDVEALLRGEGNESFLGMVDKLEF